MIGAGEKLLNSQKKSKSHRYLRQISKPLNRGFHITLLILKRTKRSRISKR